MPAGETFQLKNQPQRAMRLHKINIFFLLQGGVSESDPNCQRISHKLTQQVVEEEREEDHNSDVAVLTPNQPFRPRATVVRERTPTDRSTTAIEEDVRLNEKLPYPVQASDSNHLLEERVPPIGYGIDTKKSLDFLLDATSAVYKDFLVRGVNGSEKILRESMPFLCNGYKLRVQVKIDEDVSLSIVIMKGERDRNLPWPFDYQVLFRLINQRGNYDIRKMFRSDTNGARFKDALQKPKSESNLPLGFPKFAKRCNLLEQGFVRENVMQMECYVFKKESKLNLKPEMPSIIK